MEASLNTIRIKFSSLENWKDIGDKIFDEAAFHRISR